MRTIRVTGKGTVSVKPDTTKLVMTLEGIQKEYNKALSCCTEATEELRQLFSRFGLEKSHLKTLSFDVNTDYENTTGAGALFSKRKFVGYTYTHVLKIEFPVDNERLGKILYALSRTPTRPEFEIRYTVADQESVKNRLLQKSVVDAKGKAAVLAAAAGLTLKAIQTIDYSWSRVNFEVSPMGQMAMESAVIGAGQPSLDMDIEPDDIDLDDTVTIVWEVE